MPAPSWLLLVWSGCAATCVAAAVGALVGGRAAAPWALYPRPARGARAFGASLLAGVIVYPAVYGLLFEAAGRADLRFGLILGAAHAVLAFAAAGPATARRRALRVAAMHVVYGVAIAFLYVTP
jgi:hypothetical protein